VCSLRVGLGFFVLVGLGSRGFVWWVSFFLFMDFFFSISSFAFSLVYCRCTKGRLTLLIKSVYYLSKKKIRVSLNFCTSFFSNIKGCSSFFAEHGRLLRIYGLELCLDFLSISFLGMVFMMSFSFSTKT
jgi:hypothetical protein